MRELSIILAAGMLAIGATSLQARGGTETPSQPMKPDCDGTTGARSVQTFGHWQDIAGTALYTGGGTFVGCLSSTNTCTSIWIEDFPTYPTTLVHSGIFFTNGTGFCDLTVHAENGTYQGQSAVLFSWEVQSYTTSITSKRQCTGLP